MISTTDTFRLVSKIPVSVVKTCRAVRWDLALLVFLLVGHSPVHAQAAVETAILSASDGAFDDLMGWGVAVDGDTAVVSAPLHDHGRVDAGSAYVFMRDEQGWTEQAELLPSDRSAEDRAGQNRVALDGDTILLGAHRHPKNGSIGVGAVYVFERQGQQWVETAKLTAEDGKPGDQFGVAVDLDGDTAIIGANGDENPGTRGSVYVFVRSGNNWVQQARLFSSRSSSGMSGFGQRISIDGDTVAVGATATDFQGGDSGSAYIFVREDEVWTEQAFIQPEDGKSQDHFGVVALQGDTLLVGACRCHAFDEGGGGSVYVFTRSGDTWTQQQKFSPSDSMSNDGFGVSVALDRNKAVIGSPGEDFLDDSIGKAYLFSRNGDTWREQKQLRPSNSSANDKFGGRVAVKGNSILIGAFGEIGYLNAGSAYLFEVESGFLINSGLNDAWYNPATNGQGFLITVLPEIQSMFVAWFTFDTERPLPGTVSGVGEPGHRWLIAQGPYAGDTATMTIYVSQGGVFDSITPAANTDPAGDGTMAIEFVDCSNAIVTYDITSAGLSGEIPIERIATDNVALCQSLSSQ